MYNLAIRINNEIPYSVFFSDFELVNHPSESELQPSLIHCFCLLLAQSPH
jgi:hypothetical protein